MVDLSNYPRESIRPRDQRVGSAGAPPPAGGAADPAAPAGSVALILGGRAWSGWTSAAVTLTMEAACGQFSLALAERWGAGEGPRPIKPGAACRLTLMDETVITGYVDTVSPSYDGGAHAVSVTGRDAAGDLVDCAIEGPTEWAGLTLDRLVAAIARPFGVSVRALTDVGEAFPLFRTEPGETAWQAIERACRVRACLAYSDGRGGLVLSRTAGAEGPVTMIEGPAGVLSASADFDQRERFSDVIVKGQRPGRRGDAPGAAALGAARATDGAVGRWRPKVIVAEDLAEGVSLADRALWEVATARGRGTRITYALSSWTDAAGRPWRPNQRVKARDPWLFVDGGSPERELVVASVRLSYDDAGTRAELELAPPEAFALLPEREDPTLDATGTASVPRPVPRP